MKSSTGMFEIAIFLCLMSVCLTTAFTALQYTQRDVAAMQYANKRDARQIQQVDTGTTSFGYLGRPGAYLDAVRLSFAAGTSSADSRATMRVFGTQIKAYDMYSMNINDMTQRSPSIYASLQTWWNGFVTSKEYSCVYGSACTGSLTCPDANTKSFTYSGVTPVRTFDTTHITDKVGGYEIGNPTKLDEAKFKMRVVEVGKEPTDGTAILEYHIYVFLGSLVKQSAGSAAQIEYRWYECVMGGAGQPWVVLQ